MIVISKKNKTNRVVSELGLTKEGNSVYLPCFHRHRFLFWYCPKTEKVYKTSKKNLPLLHYTKRQPSKLKTHAENQARLLVLSPIQAEPRTSASSTESLINEPKGKPNSKNAISKQEPERNKRCSKQSFYKRTILDSAGRKGRPLKRNRTNTLRHAH